VIEIFEFELVSPVVNFFRKKGFLVQTEVPLLSKRIDIVAYKKGPLRKQIIAIELKVKNWSQAIIQASKYKLCTEQVFIAISGDFIHRIDISRLKKLGIGLIAINDGHIAIKIKPKKRNKIQFDLKNQMIGLFENG